MIALVFGLACIGILIGVISFFGQLVNFFGLPWTTAILVSSASAFVLYVRFKLAPKQKYWRGFTAFGTGANVIMVLSTIALIGIAFLDTIHIQMSDLIHLWGLILFAVAFKASFITTFLFE